MPRSRSTDPARARRRAPIDVVWALIIAAMVASLALAVLDAFEPEANKATAWLVAVAGALMCGGFGAVAASESRRHRREGDPWPKAILRGIGNGFQFLWELVF